MHKKSLLIIFLVVFIDLLGFGIVIPILPYYAKSFGASATTLGLLMMSYSLMQFLFSPFWGRNQKLLRRCYTALVMKSGSFSCLYQVENIRFSFRAQFRWPILYDNHTSAHSFSMPGECNCRIRLYQLWLGLSWATLPDLLEQSFPTFMHLDALFVMCHHVLYSFPIGQIAYIIPAVGE